jgi:phosphoglycerate kinase
VHHLEELIGVQIQFAEDTVGPIAKSMANNLQRGQILLLENTRFHEGETKGDESFATQLSLLGNHYINDAFGTAHRSHASTAVIAKFFRDEEKEFGLLMQAEIENAEKVISNPKKPFVAILGGAKVSDKIQLIENLLTIADHIIIGGAMAYTFIKARGGHIGNSLCENEFLDLARQLEKKAKEKDVKIHIPVDSIIANEFSETAEFKICNSNEIPEGWMGLDIGPQSIQDFKQTLIDTGTIIWNGPLGVFEMEKFSKGTYEIAAAVAFGTDNGAFSLVGGGDSVSAINNSGLNNKISFVSTGGGAMLEFLEGKELPGIVAIKPKSIQPLDQ